MTDLTTPQKNLGTLEHVETEGLLKSSCKNAY